MVVPGVGAFDRPASSDLQRGGFALVGDHPDQAAAGEFLPGLARVVAGVEVNADVLRYPADLDQRVQRRGEQRRVVAVGWGADDPERDPASVDHHRAFDAQISSVYWTSSGYLAAARRLGDAPVDRDVGQLQADHAVVAVTHDLLELIDHPSIDPLIPASSQRRGRAACLCDQPVAHPENHDLNKFIEHHPVGHPQAMAAQRMGVLALRK